MCGLGTTTVVTMSTHGTSEVAQPTFAGLYGGLAFLVVALTAAPFYANTETDTLRITYFSIWQMLGRSNGGGLDVFSILLLAIMVGLCVRATIRPVRSVALPLGVTAIALVAVLMVGLRVGADRDAALSATGSMLMATGIAAMVLGVGHAIHLTILKARGVL